MNWSKMELSFTSLLLLLLNISVVIAISQQQRTCISNLPPFVPQEEGRGALLPVGIQGLVPSYRFSCDGRIIRWGVAMEGRGENSIELQVWRQKEGSEDGKTFELVGSNYFFKPLEGVELEGVKLMYYQPDRARQIPVKPGDIVGFYLDGNPDLIDNFQLRLDDVQGGVVEYDHAHSPYDTIHRDTLATTLTNTAPLITVNIETTNESTVPPTPPTDTPTTRSTNPQGGGAGWSGTHATSGRTVPTPPTDTPTTRSTNPQGGGAGSVDTRPPPPPSSHHTTTTTTIVPVSQEIGRNSSNILIWCALVGGLSIMAAAVVVVMVMVVVLCVRKGKRRSPQDKESSLTTSTRRWRKDNQLAWSLSSSSSTVLTNNPAYNHAHIGLIASWDWLPRQGKYNFQIWRANDYEMPIPTYPPANLPCKLEQSCHIYECPMAFLQSSHHYEQI